MSDCLICDSYKHLIDAFGNDIKAINSLKKEFNTHKEKYHGVSIDEKNKA
jgi:hypothetical protein